jgi:hypothetical protein
MTEKEANGRLINNHDTYFDRANSKITRYAAVVKESNNDFKLNDYLIEIAYDNGDYKLDYGITSANFNSKTNLIENLNLSESIKKDIEKGDATVISTPNILYQDKKNDNDCNQSCLLGCKGFCEDIFSESTKKYQKLTGGISVFDSQASMSFGTAGAFFKTKNDNNIYLLSNYHVLLNKSGRINDTIVHPSKSDGGRDVREIGRVFWKKDIFKGSFNIMDAAIALIDEREDIDIGRYTRCNQIRFSGLSHPKLGDNVRKCGRTTGLTFGEVRSINCTVNISNESNELDLYRKQILTTIMTQPGDSGSVLVNDQNLVIGLFFAGNNVSLSFANNIKMIFNEIENENSNFKFKKFV